MIEQNQRPLLSTSPGDLDTLQQRAKQRRLRHQQDSRSIKARWQQTRSTFRSPARSLSKLPARFLLHAVVALVLPVAILLSQLQPGMLAPMMQPAVPQGSGDFVAPIAPLSLDTPVQVGDAPLEDSPDIPVPLSLVSRSEALAPVVVPATIAGERIYLRNGPGTAYDAVGRMSAETPVQVIGRYEDWFQIRESVDKPVYWASGELLNIPESAVYSLFEIQKDALPPLPPPKVGKVRETGLQLRDGPGTNYVPMTKLQSGTQLDLLEVFQDWYHVGIPGGADGWVKAEFMDVDGAIANRLLIAESIPDPNPALVGAISDNAVNLRKGPDSKYDKVGNINAGQQVDLLGKYNDWFKIKTPDGSSAWVFSDFLSTSPHVSRRVPVTSDFPALPARSRTVAGGDSRSSARPGASTNLANIAASGDVAGFAAQFAGSRYRWGGASPSGFDCSGLNMYVYKKFGVSLPHSAAAQFSTRYGASVGSIGNLAPGDLVFFANTGRRGISHTGIYIGGGRIVHAMTPRYGVQISNIHERYWTSHFYGAIRVRR